MTTLLDAIKAKSPKLAEEIEYKIAEAISQAVSKARFDRQQRESNQA